jgi:RHS repeat-associated protein
MDGTGSASYIDDMVLRDWDKNSGWTSAADSTKEVRHYYLHNWRHDVSAILTDTGKQVESIKYLSYGIPIGLPVGDVDCDGDFDATDEDAIKNYSGPHDVRYDTDLDGDVDADDKSYALSITGTHQTLGFGVLTSTAVFNRKGYAGYEHAWELDGTKYHVRHRVLDAELGRWNRRDPLGYVDGMALYGYAHIHPLSGSDPNGTIWWMCGAASNNNPNTPNTTAACPKPKCIPRNHCPDLGLPDDWAPPLFPTLDPLPPGDSGKKRGNGMCCNNTGIPMVIRPESPPPETQILQPGECAKCDAVLPPSNYDPNPFGCEPGYVFKVVNGCRLNIFMTRCCFIDWSTDCSSNKSRIGQSWWPFNVGGCVKQWW